MEEINGFSIGGNKIHAVAIKDVLRQIQEWIEEKSKTHYVVAANVHVVMEGYQNETMKATLGQADLVTPDGMPLVFVGRLRGFPLRHRTDGPGLMAAALEQGAPIGWRHYFYGSTPEVLAVLQSQIRERWPNIKIAGSYSPPFRPLTIEEDQAVVKQINAASADILWVGLGCPKQEHWMFDHKNTLRIPVMLGVGQAFDLLAGTKQRAPRWMCNYGLEWFYRLIHEPRRLWKRYFLYNPWFIVLVLYEQIIWLWEKKRKISFWFTEKKRGDQMVEGGMNNGNKG
jgi:N-acetylglucosaminyldiphosphoundecaprenol N-acetyl-beta-D-mannosaminyltransferase